MRRDYSILRLNNHSDRSWAVIEPSGKIVEDGSGNLFMRLTRLEAALLAKTLADGPPSLTPIDLARPLNTLPI